MSVQSAVSAGVDEVVTRIKLSMGACKYKRYCNSSGKVMVDEDENMVVDGDLDRKSVV